MVSENKLKSVKGPFVAFVFVVVAFGGGFYLGKVQGTADLQKKADDLTKIVQVVYPPPPEVIHTMSGTVTDRYGAVFTAQFDDPADYLPHLDGSPRAKVTRQVTMDAATQVRTIDYTKVDRYGSPTIATSTAAAVMKGSSVKFTTDANIRDSQTFTATSVDVILH